MTLLQRLYNFITFSRFEQPDVTADCIRFKNDPAFQEYLNQARMNIHIGLYALEEDDIDQFKQLIRSKMALEGLENFIESTILDEKLKESRRQA